jgi:hypothetical protein
MSGLAHGRGKAIGLTAAAAVVVMTISGGGAAQAARQNPTQVRAGFNASPGMGAFRPLATAADTIPSVCTVKSYAPNKIVLGGAKVTKTFSVTVTGCTLADWLVIAAPFLGDSELDTSGVAGNYAFEAQDDQGNPILDDDGKPVTVQLQPTISLSPQSLSNANAGKITDGAFVGAWGEEDPADTDTVTVEPAQAALPLTLQRRATFGSTFNASPEPVKKGKKITLKATLTRVNWNGAKTLKYAGFAGKAQVQFKAAGQTTYVTVKTVTATAKGKISTTVKATKTGTWRLFFPGISTTAPATSATDAVKVN